MENVYDILTLGINAVGTRDYTFIGRISTACPNDTIVDFISSSPLFTTKGNIVKISNYTWSLSVSWGPQSNQIGELSIV